MLILGPTAAPTISAVTWYPPSSAGSLMTLPSSTTSRAGSVTLAPTSPDSLSTVRTSSTDAFSCLPPQRTIAYTESSLLFEPARTRSGVRGSSPQPIPSAGTGLAYLAHLSHPADWPLDHVTCADHKGYQTARVLSWSPVRLHHAPQRAVAHGSRSADSRRRPGHPPPLGCSPPAHCRRPAGDFAPIQRRWCHCRRHWSRHGRERRNVGRGRTATARADLLRKA